MFQRDAFQFGAFQMELWNPEVLPDPQVWTVTTADAAIWSPVSLPSGNSWTPLAEE